MRGCTMPTAVVSAALAALVCCTALPLASAQAFAASSAGAGGAQVRLIRWSRQLLQRRVLSIAERRLT